MIKPFLHAGHHGASATSTLGSKEAIRGFLKSMNPSVECRKSAGFSLVELLVVIALIILIAGFATSGMRGLVEGDRLSKALIGISGAMEIARQTAISRGTYTWVGMNSEADPKTGQNTITVATFASEDGTRAGGSDLTKMQVISKAMPYDSVILLPNQPAGNKLDASKLPDVGNAPDPSQSTFHPKSKDLPSRLSNLNFNWVVVFTPRGEACIDKGGGTDGDSLSLTQAIRMWVSGSKGHSPSAVESKAASMIQVNGITGQVDVFHP